jgi:hypothetical protein
VDKGGLKGEMAGRASSGALNSLFDREVSNSRTARSRAGDVVVTRPVPGSAVLHPSTISWRCAPACDGEQELEIYNFREDETVWTGSGSSGLLYDGPALKPGSYLLKVGPGSFSFTVPKKAEREMIDSAKEEAERGVKALKAQGVTDPAALTEVVVAIYWQAGLSSEALYHIDRAIATHPNDEQLQQLRRQYEARAGLAP